MDDKAKIFKHLQDRLSAVSNERGEKLRDELGDLEKHVVLTRIFLNAEKEYAVFKKKTRNEA
ncbi:MAG: hypothetical protein CBC09_02095 [Cellvibrionales bacterium TMED49]|nr:MAG: hypothetical protein CBC09_02095 [Cellvibrionales bacterium TMED49]|tara:strand:- start:707 stop:892 length:186 start_codon:yes stop_codon:yes gene_type:complete